MGFILWAQLNLAASGVTYTPHAVMGAQASAFFSPTPSPQIVVSGGGRQVRDEGGGRAVTARGGGRRTTPVGGGR